MPGTLDGFMAYPSVRSDETEQSPEVGATAQGRSEWPGCDDSAAATFGVVGRGSTIGYLAHPRGQGAPDIRASKGPSATAVELERPGLTEAPFLGCSCIREEGGRDP
jgi:hypothetical protein